LLKTFNFLGAPPLISCGPQGYGGALYFNNLESLIVQKLRVGNTSTIHDGIISVLGRPLVKVFFTDIKYFLTSASGQGDCLLISDCFIFIKNLHIYGLESNNSAKEVNFLCDEQEEFVISYYILNRMDSNSAKPLDLSGALVG
jgi:hypothetical protein